VAPQPDESVAAEYHTVVAGDTLSEIASSTGVPMAKLRELNQMEGDVVWLGQKLRIK
jgi:N-acetylmuramoyl-L-alanine amidase